MNSQMRAFGQPIPGNVSVVHSGATVGARLKFYIFDRILEGTAGGLLFRCAGYSGGGGGRQLWRSNHGRGVLLQPHARPNPYLEGNPFQTRKRGANDKDTLHYGPLPVGLYKIAWPTEANTTKWGADLRRIRDLPGWEGERNYASQIKGRQGFRIHGPGPHGSAGCIVVNYNDLYRLLSLLVGCPDFLDPRARSAARKEGKGTQTAGWLEVLPGKGWERDRRQRGQWFVRHSR